MREQQRRPQRGWAEPVGRSSAAAAAGGGCDVLRQLACCRVVRMQICRTVLCMRALADHCPTDQAALPAPRSHAAATPTFDGSRVQACHVAGPWPAIQWNGAAGAPGLQELACACLPSRNRVSGRSVAATRRRSNVRESSVGGPIENWRLTMQSRLHVQCLGHPQVARECGSSPPPFFIRRRNQGRP